MTKRQHQSYVGAAREIVRMHREIAARLPSTLDPIGTAFNKVFNGADPESLDDDDVIAMVCRADRYGDVRMVSPLGDPVAAAATAMARSGDNKQWYVVAKWQSLIPELARVHEPSCPFQTRVSFLRRMVDVQQNIFGFQSVILLTLGVKWLHRKWPNSPCFSLNEFLSIKDIPTAHQVAFWYARHRALYPGCTAFPVPSAMLKQWKEETSDPVFQHRINILELEDDEKDCIRQVRQRYAYLRAVRGRQRHSLKKGGEAIARYADFLWELRVEKKKIAQIFQEHGVTRQLVESGIREISKLLTTPPADIEPFIQDMARRKKCDAK